MATGSEYGGVPGIIQPGETQTTDLGTSAPGHNDLTPEELLRIGNRAGRKEAAGVSASVVLNENGAVVSRVAYSEDQALADYREGNNF